MGYNYTGYYCNHLFNKFMRKINLSISGCMGRWVNNSLDHQKDKNFKLVSLTENILINKKIAGIKPLKNSVDAFKKSNVIIDFTVLNAH